jgi:hypothetical protein
VKGPVMGEHEKQKQGWLERLVCCLRSGDDLTERIVRMDKQHREVRHDMKNISSRLDLIRRLVLNSRDESPVEQHNHDGSNNGI